MLKLNQIIFLAIFVLFESALGDVRDDEKIAKILAHQGIIYDNSKVNGKYIDSTMEQVKLYAYYPTETTAPSGSYVLYLRYYEKSGFSTQYIIGRIEHNGKSGKWVIVNNKFWSLYSKGRRDMDSFEIFLKYVAGSNPHMDPEYAKTITKDWRFVMYFKTREEKFYGNLDDPQLYDNVTKEYCTDYIHTTGDARFIGALCPFDPKTNKRMELCLNWRRDDMIGKKCNDYLSDEERENSIVNFCGMVTRGEGDCRCVNRHFNNYELEKERQNRHSKFDGPDICWYEPCISGKYLKIKPIVECPKCEVKLTFGSYRDRNNITKCIHYAKILMREKTAYYITTPT